jgi:porphobilinogen deaminase
LPDDLPKGPDLRQRLITLDARIERLREPSGDAAQLAVALLERRQLLEEIADAIRNGNWIPPGGSG